MHHTEDGKGYLVNPTAFPGWQKVPLASWLHDRLGMPVYLENNATAAAVGERWYGAGRQIGHFLLHLFRQWARRRHRDERPAVRGLHRQCGRDRLPPDDPRARRGIGPRGGRTVRRAALHHAARSTRGCASRGATRARSRISIGCSPQEHPALLEWMDDASDHLTGLVLAIEYVLDPEAICFGGRLSDRIVGGLMERVARQLPVRRVARKSHRRRDTSSPRRASTPARSAWRRYRSTPSLRRSTASC